MMKIGCRLGSTKIASSPQLAIFSKVIQFECFLGLLIPILGWGIHSDTFKTLKLDIEKISYELISLVQ